jgi:hypothetical protein
MQMCKVGLGMAGNQQRRARKQQCLELGVVHLQRQRPTKFCLAGAPEVTR